MYTHCKEIVPLINTSFYPHRACAARGKVIAHGVYIIFSYLEYFEVHVVKQFLTTSSITACDQNLPGLFLFGKGSRRD